nr:hypothetical protein [uncultured Devosia sp.]
MIWGLNHQAVRTTVLAAAILVSPVVWAVEVTTRALAEALGATESLTKVGNDLKAVISTDLGFTSAQIDRWHAAVDAAFTVDELEADFLKALESHTSLEQRDAALAYQRSDLAIDVGTYVNGVFAREDPAALVEAGQGYVASASDSQKELLTNLFAGQRAPERDGVDMDIYYRALAIMADPVIGADGAKEWVESAQYLRDAYSQDNFHTRVAAYSRLPGAQLAEVLEKLNEPLLVEFSDRLVLVMSDTLHAATDRLETEYE